MNSSEKAIVWLEKAAEQGHAEAQCQLGKCYAKGKGVNKDFQQAVEWFTKAAEQENVEAQYCLGICYAKGKGVEEDLEKAVAWFKKAADQGHEKSKIGLLKVRYQLGMFYVLGIGVEENIEKAVEQFKKIQDNMDVLELKEEDAAFVKNIILASQGDAEAQYLVGMYLSKQEF